MRDLKLKMGSEPPGHDIPQFIIGPELNLGPLEESGESF